ncbi:hypothetical protein HN51_016684 [Arachis hypogaea]|uniref:Cytochrome P450 n=2 Tax=Arachis TaxID=3817 RepID=A0A445CU71_ARAHY|nr:cytochrome P450 94B3 [Arachis duranensis]XP_025606064.1 cytochrome P450 94B3-like [Arachis hypogaea]QHO47301.1 Cytochrome P450 [Arachis hypogaea]RYR54464.1 hypothetical protein Ahy_A06g029746 [Arachis hypogaea]
MGVLIPFFLLFFFFLLLTHFFFQFWRTKKLSHLISFYRNRNRLLEWFTELVAESPTNTIVVHRLGSRRTIVTANPSNVEYILKTNFFNFPKGKPFTHVLGDFLGNGIFNVDGDRWFSQRKVASHEFSARSLRKFLMYTLAEEVYGRLVPALEGVSYGGSVLDLQEILARFSFNVICKFAMGSGNACSLDPRVPVSSLWRAFDVAAAISARRGAAPLFVIWKVKRLLGVGSERRLKESILEVHTHVMKLIHEKKKKTMKNNKEDFLSRLICAGYEDDVVRDMVISFVMAGKDTTSAALTWFFWILSHYPDVEEKILKEAEANEPLNYESLKRLNYLKACLCESMRLFPPVAWDSKHASCDDVLPDGTVVKAGDRVTYFPYGMGRLEALWGLDRFEFRPERWFTGGKWTEVSPYKFPIFQAGPRVCLGKEMAFVQTKYVVVSILKRFKIRLVSTNKPTFVPLLTAHMAGGLKIFISNREKRK